MSGYSISHISEIDAKVTFIRITPTDISMTLREVFQSLSELSWISAFDDEYIRESFNQRANDTITYIAENIITNEESEITSNSGEYVISELARKTIVEQKGYLDIPLAELFKIKDVGNHGFDFYSKNNDLIILFGEAKYVANQSAYGRAFKAITKFIENKQDVSDIADIDRFCCQQSKQKFQSGQKGYIAAFASKQISTDRLIQNIRRNTDYNSLIAYNELICVAVDI